MPANTTGSPTLITLGSGPGTGITSPSHASNGCARWAELLKPGPAVRPEIRCAVADAGITPPLITIVNALISAPAAITQRPVAARRAAAGWKA